MNDYYEQVIDLVSEEQDWKSICLALAKRDPKLFCSIVSNLDPLYDAAEKIFLSDGFVTAIKYVRNESAMGLREAFDFCKPIKEKYSVDET